jgi:hypothetical protein
MTGFHLFALRLTLRSVGIALALGLAAPVQASAASRTQPAGVAPNIAATVPVWQMHEIELVAHNRYENPYTDVEVWVMLQGPGFERKVYGFWDGDRIFRVRIVPTGPGKWSWTSGSSRNDPGLNGRRGGFDAVEWTESEKEANPNRRGFLRVTSNGRALEYRDGTPFFLFGDTWWSASTRVWSWDSAGGKARISFQDAVRIRKTQGYNTFAMIAAFPNWAEDGKPAAFSWNKAVARAAASWQTHDMVDESGGRPFMMREGEGSVADYERIRPSYFQHLDRKMQHLSDEGLISFFETVRRDHGQSWRAFTPDWKQSFARYVNYLVARYGGYNMVFSALHYDAPGASIPLEEWRDAVMTWYTTYGLPPFGQPVTALTNERTDQCWGHGDSAPWLQLHGVGNKGPRNNRYAQIIYDQFQLPSPLPTLCQEPFYPGWRDAPLDAYPPRSMAWSCVLQGGLAGHIYGSGYFCGKDGVDGLTGSGSDTLPVLKDFILSEGAKYQDLIPVRRLASPSYEGSAVIARTADRRLVMAYFQQGAAAETLTGLIPSAAYIAQWFDPRNGNWRPVGTGTITADASGAWRMPPFPNDASVAAVDWALKLTTADL